MEKRKGHETVCNRNEYAVYIQRYRFSGKNKEEFPEAVFILVGTHVSALPEETLGFSKAVDAVTRREYDYTVREIARCLAQGGDWRQVKGITYRDGEEIKSNPDREYIQNLDEIPFAAEFIKEHLNYKDYFFAGSYYPEIQLFTEGDVRRDVIIVYIPRQCMDIITVCGARKMLWMSFSIL